MTRLAAVIPALLLAATRVVRCFLQRSLAAVSRPLAARTASWPFQSHVLAYFVEHCDCRFFTLQRKAGEQQVVAQGVNQSRDSLRAHVDFCHELWREHRLVRHSSLLQ